MSANSGSDAASTSQSQAIGTTRESSKYRAYVAAVDKALKSFESTTEWADLISSLTKLCKVLQQSSKNFSEIPKAVIVAKRLSQCLHPALPSGVHTKALETYKQLFTILNKDHNLGKELYLYAIGLFPLMDYCGIKVKGELLTLLEEFILPLGVELKPALPGFIATILLGLDEGTEYHDRSLALLDKLMGKVGEHIFYTCLWEAMLHSPTVRLPALTYVNMKFDRKAPLDEQFSIIAGVDHADHMIAALCAVADDVISVPLLHRHMFDFLCAAFPLNSPHVTQADFIQLIRRCIFIVLRRDMSLTRRFYQWILNKKGEITSIPSATPEDVTDIEFFNTYSLPLLKASMIEVLKLDTMDVPVNTAVTTTGGSYENVREYQTHYTEVRLCRAIQYFQDRPFFGLKVLESIMPIFLEYISIQDYENSLELTKKCEEMDIGFYPDWITRFEQNQTKMTNDEREKRLDEIKKNFNSLLNNLETGFLWNFLCDMFGNLLKKNYKNETDEDEQELNLTDEEKEKLQFNEEKRREHISLYPIIVTFCLKIVQLDNHSDIRGIYLPQLLNAIMFTIKKHGCDSFGRDNLIALIAVCRQILIEINQNIITTIETGVDVDDDKTDDGKFKLSAKNSSARKKQQIDEQTKIENCLESCQELLIHVCEWYTKNRDRDKAGILLSMTTLLRDFSEFPFYCYDTDDSNKFLGLENLIPIMPTWMKSLQQVIDVSTWQISINDFDVRSKIVDLIICLYIRSLSLIEQHMASIGKDTFDYMKMATITTTAENKPSTTTLLFKPMLTEENLRSIDESKIFENVSKVLWNTLAMNTLANDHQMASFLLHRLHSRNINDMSSDVETIILNDLTTMDKDKSSEACRRFKKLWTLTRGSTHDNVYFGVPYKSFNRVIMVLLGQIGDDTKKNSSLKTLATSWFIDCAKHGDLPRILQMLGTMLLNPSTARVSIQYMQIQNRITNEQVKSMPKDINSLTLLTANGKQSFHHVCRDVSLIKNGTNSSVNCTTNAAWISDLKKYLLIPSLNTEQTFGFSPTLISASSSTTTTTTTPAAIKTHKRTISDIPQFDDEEIENESIGDYLYDSNIDPDVVDCLMNVIDNVIEHLEQEEHFDEVYQSIIDSNIKDEFVITGNFKNNDRRSLPANFDIPRKNDKREEQSKSLLIENNDKDDIKENINGIMKEPMIEKNIIHTPPQQPIIKRVKTGHRRQDSLQESIFSSGEKELRLFDPAELPTLTAPGDAKQPLLEEAQAHMLLYMESPSCVDLGRIQGVFKTLSLLMRTNKGASLGRMMVHCMAFNQTSILPQTITGSPCQLVEYLTRHYKAIQGEGFWYDLNGQNDSTKGRHCSFLELFCTVSLYYLRSYFLNSPISPISETELTTAWECKIAALDFFTDLLRELIALITDTKSREFVNFILQIYRSTKLQRCLISFLLTAVPVSRNINEALSVSADIAEFNSSPTKKGEFGDLAFAYHRALLDFASIVISLEYHMNIGLQIYAEQNLLLNVEKIAVVNKLNYNTTQNRLNLRDPRVLVVELKLFISVIVNALQRMPERHELWLQFLINVLPYLEKALPTICIHVIEQLCKNIDTCINYAYGHVGGTTFDTGSIAEELIPITSPVIRKRASVTLPTESYPENYALTVLEALTTIMHHCLLESPMTSSSMMGGVVTSNQMTTSTIAPVMTNTNTGSPTHSINSIGTSSLSGTTPNQGSSSQGNNPSGVVSVVNMIPGTKGATEMLGNLISKVFTSNESSGNISNMSNQFDNKSATTIWKQARNTVIENLPQILSTICDIWAVAQRDAIPKLPIGTSEQLRNRVFDLINPLAKRHTNFMLNALSSVWMSRASRNLKTDIDQLNFIYSEEQLTLANLLLSLKVVPFQHAIVSVSDCLKDMAKSNQIINKGVAVSIASPEKNVLTEIAMLEMIHGCVRILSSDELHECWSALTILFSEAPLITMSPRGIFLIFKILDDFVRIVGSQRIIDDKQISKAVQEACQRTTDSVNTIVGWQLETTTWLKRTLVVKQDTTTSTTIKSGESTPMMETKSIISSIPTETTSIKGSTISLATRDAKFSTQYETGNSSSQLALSSSIDKKSTSNLRASIKDTNNNKKDPANSTQALFLLAECLTELIDSICKSEDKEKLLPTLQAVWSNTLPYLKSKSARNSRCFLASSQFLASLSSFTYMRTVWKKQTMELLFESTFFKMDIHSLKQWLIIIDNLMTNDKTSFKELLTKIPTGQNSTLSSLITSKDAEWEMRAQSLKRLAFVVLSSQMDQYGHQLPDIQERLSDNLRLCQVPIVHAQVFTCYRVLLIRIRPQQFVSIWPSMATELVQVLIQIENQLHLITGDSTNVNHSGDDLKCSRDDQWMQLYLSACKLLEALCTLPSGYVSQFQTCHWAFVASLVSDSMTDQFVPFATRIYKLLASKYGEITMEEQHLHSASLQSIKTLNTFGELRPFFCALASQHSTVLQGLTGGGNQECHLIDASVINGTLTSKSAISRLEHGLYVDFAEHLQL